MKYKSEVFMNTNYFFYGKNYNCFFTTLPLFLSRKKKARPDTFNKKFSYVFHLYSFYKIFIHLTKYRLLLQATMFTIFSKTINVII